MKASFLATTILTMMSLAAQTNHYTVTASDQKNVSVKARFALISDTIYIYMRGGTSQLPEGEANFVKDLSVKDDKGTTINYRYAGEGNWILANTNPGQTVNIQYNILADHKNYNWDHVGGVDEAAFTNKDGLFFTGYTLFIIPDVSMDSVIVDFDLPTGWKASTPWKQQKTNRFFVESGRYLVNNCLMIGKHSESIIKLTGMDMRLAIDNDLSYARPLVAKTMQRLIPAYQQMFGGTPAPAYLVAMSKERMTDGSAFRRSFSQIFKDSIDEKGIATWGYIIAHEILHLWNGHSIMPAGQEEWYKEGFTDYVTNVLLRRTGLIDDQLLYRKMEHMIRRYWLDRYWQKDTVSIRATGDNKEQLRFGVYGGGAVVAIALEVELRKATGNKKGIYDLMGSMFSEFGMDKKTYAVSDIIRHVNKLAGKDLQLFFDRYVTGREYLDLIPYLREMGLDLHTVIEEVYVSPANNATTAQKAMYRSIFTTGR
jgi:predicted metalloprotease with PDZ domain